MGPQEEWYTALYEEDSNSLLELLEENSDLQLWKQGWKSDRCLIVRGRPENYWGKRHSESWMGRTALHVAARRGCVSLLKKTLQLLCETYVSDQETFQGILRAEDGHYRLDAIAMAMVNGCRDIVTLLLEADMKCHCDKYGIRVIEEFNTLETEKDTRRDTNRLVREIQWRRIKRQEGTDRLEKLREITSRVIDKFTRESEIEDCGVPVVDDTDKPLFEKLVLHRYDLHRDFNFLPRDEYLFHFLFIGCGAAEATRLREILSLGDYSVDEISSLAGRINELVITEIAEEASKTSLDGFLEFLWARQDGQGRPPLHIAAQTEQDASFLRRKILTLTRPQLTVPNEALKKIIRTCDGAGRTALHRAVALGDQNKTFASLLRLEDDVHQLTESEAPLKKIKHKPDEAEIPTKVNPHPDYRPVELSSYDHGADDVQEHTASAVVAPSMRVSVERDRIPSSLPDHRRWPTEDPIVSSPGSDHRQMATEDPPLPFDADCPRMDPGSPIESSPGNIATMARGSPVRNPRSPESDHPIHQTNTMDPGSPMSKMDPGLIIEFSPRNISEEMDPGSPIDSSPEKIATMARGSPVRNPRSPQSDHPIRQMNTMDPGSPMSKMDPGLVIEFSPGNISEEMDPGPPIESSPGKIAEMARRSPIPIPWSVELQGMAEGSPTRDRTDGRVSEEPAMDPESRTLCMPQMVPWSPTPAMAPGPPLGPSLSESGLIPSSSFRHGNLQRPSLDERFTGYLRRRAKKFPINEFQFDIERKRVAAEAFRGCLRETEFYRYSRSSCKSETGTEYSIHPDRLSKSNGLSESIWSGCMPIHSAILHNLVDVVQQITSTDTSYQRKSQECSTSNVPFKPFTSVDVIQAGMKRPLDEEDMAVIRGDVEDACTMLRHFDKVGKNYSQALSSAARAGRYDLLQYFINEGHDPVEERFNGETPLHFAVKGLGIRNEDLRTGIDLCGFVTCDQILKWKKKNFKDMDTRFSIEHDSQEVDSLEMAIVERQGCINLLIQQGCDIFERNGKGETPYPSRDASSKFVSWWHEQQTKEFAAAQSTQATAANAISVTAALVATASYVGPLQPPVGYNEDGQLQLEIMAVQVFIVCDTMSFYLGIAAIIAALIPCLPMPQRSMTEELRRTRWMVNIAVALLFPSVICVLVAFAASSLAIIQSNQTAWNRGGLTIGTTSVGGLICLIMIGIFTIRVATIVGHRNKSIRNSGKKFWF